MSRKTLTAEEARVLHQVPCLISGLRGQTRCAKRVWRLAHTGKRKAFSHACHGACDERLARRIFLMGSSQAWLLQALLLAGSCQQSEKRTNEILRTTRDGPKKLNRVLHRYQLKRSLDLVSKRAYLRRRLVRLPIQEARAVGNERRLQ